MTVTITMNRDELLDEVSKVTAYLGKKATSEDGTPLYADTATTTYNAEILNDFINDARNTLIAVLRQFVLDNEPDDDALTVTLLMPSNFNEALAPTIVDECRSVVVDLTVSEWLALGADPRAEHYAQRAADTAKSLIANIHVRIPPKRPNFD